MLSAKRASGTDQSYIFSKSNGVNFTASSGGKRNESAT